MKPNKLWRRPVLCVIIVFPDVRSKHVHAVTSAHVELDEEKKYIEKTWQDGGDKPGQVREEDYETIIKL